MENGTGAQSQRKFAVLRAWNYVLGSFNFVLVVIIGVIVYRSNWLAPAHSPHGAVELFASIIERQRQNTSPSSPIEYKDFIAIILSALSAMIAVLGLLLAAAAIWGYQELKGAALRAAVDQVEKLVPSIASRAAVRCRPPVPGRLTSGL